MKSYGDRIEALKKQREKNSASSQPQSTVQNEAPKQTASTNSGNTKYSSRVTALLQQREDNKNASANRTIAEPETFHSFGGKYIKNSDGGYSKITNDWRVSEKDRKSRIETGHDTLGTDLGQAIKGGLETWKANQFSTLATIDNVIGAVKEKDNFYQPEVGSAVWKQNQASSARTRAAGELTEGAKEGRGFVGSTVMEVSSQAVMNGIEAALRTIPVIGNVLGTASFLSRSFGGKTQELRDQGKSISTQVLSGVISAGIEQFTESMSRIGGIRNYAGADTGWLDNAYNALESTIAKKLGPVVAKMSTTMLAEGVEEIMSDILNPLITGALEDVTKDTKLLGDFEAEDWQSIGDIAYDGLIGALSAIGGGIVESAKTSETYNKVGRDNALYSAAIREEFQKERAKAKAHDSIFREMDSAFTREHKKSLQQWVSERTGKIVSKKEALHIAAEEGMMEDIYRRTAKQFAKDSFANEVISESVLEEAVYNYLMNGEFAEELNVSEDVQKQIVDLSNEIMIAYCEEQIAEAKKSKSKKNQARIAMLQSSLGNLMRKNRGKTATETATVSDDVDVTEAKTFRHTAEEIEADRARRDAELHPEQKPAAPRQTIQEISAEDLAYVEKNNPELWAEYQKAKSMPTDRAGISAMRDALAKVGDYLKARPTSSQNVQNNEVKQQNNEVKKPAVEIKPKSKQQNKTEVVTRERTDAEKKLSKADQKKVDQLFDGKKTSLVPPVDDNGMAIVNAIYARAKQEGKEVVSKNYGNYGRRSYSILSESEQASLFEQQEKINELRNKLGLAEKETTINRLASDNSQKPKLNGTMYFSYGNQKRDGVTADTTFDAILNGERTATTRESKWKGHDQWKRAKVGDIVRFSENKDGSGRAVDVEIDGKYTVKDRIDKDTLRIADDNGKTYRLSRGQWSKKEGWSENSKWFGEMQPGDVWLNYHMLSSGESNHSLVNEQPITSFRGDNFFLSNFYETPVTIDGITYPTAENAFQAQKCKNEEDKQKFVNISASQAKALGKKVSIVSNWNDKRVEVMRKVLEAKFSNPELRQKLAATKGVHLEEGNSWGDTFWGVNNGFGANYLGRLLEDVRDGISVSESRVKDNRDGKLTKSIKTILSKAVSGDLSDLSEADLQYGLNVALKEAGLSGKRGSKSIFDDITNYVLGDFEQSLLDRQEPVKGKPNMTEYTSSAEGKLGGLSVRNNLGYGYSDAQMKTMHYPNSSRTRSVLDDNYSNESYNTVESLDISDTAKALFNLIDEMVTNRRIDINRWYAVSSNGNTAEIMDESANAVENAEELAEESELPLNDSDFDRGGVFSDMNEDTVRDIVSRLREGIDEGFQTEESVNLRSSLMSGFAPSAEYTISEMSVAQRRKLLELAFPDDDFSISPYNPNIITDSNDSEFKQYERGERKWAKRHTKGGAEDETSNMAKNAYGYIPVDAEKKTQIGTNKKGEPVYAAGFVDKGKVSVKEKLAAKKAVRLRAEVKSEVAELQRTIDNLGKSADNIKAILKSSENVLYKNELKRQLEELAEKENEYKEEQKKAKARLRAELGDKAFQNSAIREEKRMAVNDTWIDRLSETALDSIFGDKYNGYYGEHKLTKEEAEYGKELLAERRSGRGDETSQFRRDIGSDTVDARRDDSVVGTPVRTGERQPTVSGDSGARQFSDGFTSGSGRVTYKSKGSYLSTFNDSESGNGKQVGRILTAEEATGEQFDSVRERFESEGTSVLFLDGQIYDSETGTLNDGCVLTFSNGETVAIVQMNEASQSHERTHLSINKQRAAGNRVFIVNYENTVRGLFDSEPSYVFSLVKFQVSEYGGYSGNEALDEIVANINAGLERYGVDFSKYKSALENSTLYQYISESSSEAVEQGETTLNRLASDEEIPSLNEFRKQRGETKRNIYEMNEERAITAKDEENLNLSDGEYYERREADKSIPSIQDFEREKAQQPKAESKMSPSEALEIADRTFGKGRKRVSGATERFQRIQSPFASDSKEKYGGIGAVIKEKLSNMFERLVDVNDGYGTIQGVLDELNTWRDDNIMKDYWDEDVAERLKKIISDADDENWTFDDRQQKAISQAYEEAINALTAKIKNVDKDSVRLADLSAEATANKLNVKKDGLVHKAIQKWMRMQATTDTALKFFGGFKGKGQFYDLAKDIKKSVADRMVNYVDAYSYFDDIKKMDGFKEFSENKKTYKIETKNTSFRHDQNPFNGHEFTLQQIVTIDRLIKTLDKTFERSDARLADRIRGFVVRDAKGNNFTVNFQGTALQTANGLQDIRNACYEILNQEGDVFKVAREYSKACDKMFAMMGKKVSAVKKALTGNGLSLIGEAYTPVLWANEDGTPADFNFNDDDRIKPPSFLYQRTAKQGHLVVSDISYIVDKYIEKASDYAATAQIKDTLSRLRDGTSLVNKSKGLNSSLAENFGRDAGEWFNEYVKDLTEYGDSSSIFAELRRRMQQGALIGSPSVMMKQISSYWSAMGLLSPEALHMAYRWKLGAKALDNSDFNKLVDYRKISGKIDPTLSEVIQDMSRYGNVSNSRVFKLFTNGIQEQDFKTVDNLYTATMIDTYLKNQNKGVEYFTSGEFQNDIDSKFTEVMMRSQPMFDTELRAEYARTDNELIKMTSMFRTQQTQNLNLIATAIGEYNASKGTGEQGEKLKVLQNTVRGQVQAAVSLSLLSVAADFLLHGLKKYRGDGDDDDEKPGDGKIELQRILGRIGINSVEAGAGTFWGADYLAKWLIDRMSGGETNEFYGVNFGPLTTMKNVIDNLEYAVKSPSASNIKNVATNIAQLMGIPLNNAYRIVNSAVMYTADAAGNPKHYDDALKMLDGAIKVSEKDKPARNALIDAGLSRKEANSLIRAVDVENNGINKDDLTEYYIEHPEDAEQVSILWDSMGWKQTFAKAKKSLDKKVVYNSNPLYSEMDEDESESVSKAELMNYYMDHPEIRDDLEKMYTDLGFKDFKSAVKSADKKIKFRSNPLYAEMDEDESESVSKSELVDYAIEHPEMYDILAPLYKELGFKGTFRSAIRSAESTKIKEAAEDAFYDGNYNALFESVSQMKNGKTWLTNMVKDEYPEYENMENPLLHYLTESGLSTKQIDTAVESFGGKDLVPKYKKLRETGLSPKQAVERLDIFDADDNGRITQAELAEYFKTHRDEEAIIAEFWSACGWSKTWAQYKKSKKLK